MQRSYMAFYLDGREARRPRVELDIGTLADRIMLESALDDGDPRALLDKAVREELASCGGIKKKKFLAENAEQIKEAGGDETAAFEAYTAGVTDELVFHYEPALIEAMNATLEDDEPDGEDEEEEDEEDEGDESEDED